MNVNTDNDNSIKLVSLFVFRRLIYALNIVFLQGSTVAQLFVQFFCCLLMLLFIIDVNPLNQPFLNRIEIFNEVTLLILSYFLFFFSDFVPNVYMRYALGWAFIFIAVLNIAVNWCALFFKAYLAIRDILRKYIHNNRVKLALKAKELKCQNLKNFD